MLSRRSLPLGLLGAGLLGAPSGAPRARTPEAVGAKLDADCGGSSKAAPRPASWR